MNTNKLLNLILSEIQKELHSNQNLRDRLIQLIEKNINVPKEPTARPHRRKPGPFDPMAVYREQPDTLKTRLENLEVEELKDVIAEHGMDRIKLAMKWKSKERLINLIFETVQSRAQKGDVFRTPPA